MPRPAFIAAGPSRAARHLRPQAPVCRDAPAPTPAPATARVSVRPPAKRRHVEAEAPPASADTFMNPTAAAAALAAAAAALQPLPAAALTAAAAIAGPLFEPLNPDSPHLLRTLVWADFRIAVALFVVAPLVIFLWSFDTRAADTDAVKRVMVGYWQASSLLMLTVFLNIAHVPAGSATGLFVQALIPATLVWWKDLLAEIEADTGPLARAFRAWRRPAVAAAVGGALVQLPFQGCNFGGDPLQNPMCSAWLEPPHKFHRLLLPAVDPALLQTLAFAGCSIYAAYLVWLAAVVLPRAGRSGRKDRNVFSSVSALKFLGLIDRDSPGN
jgi:hypothetical protein